MNATVGKRNSQEASLVRAESAPAAYCMRM